MQIQINGITPTEKYIGLGILIGLFIIGIICAVTIAWSNGHSSGVQEGIASVSTATPTPVPTPTPTPVVSTAFVPYVTQFTVLSTTLTNNRYQIQTTDGRVLDTATYAEWRTIYPRYTYSAVVYDTVWGELKINNVYVIGRPAYPDNYLRYYHNGQYYDNHWENWEYKRNY